MEEPAYITVIKEGIEERLPFGSVSIFSNSAFGSHEIFIKFLGLFTRWNGFKTGTILGLGMTVTDYAMTHGPDASIIIERFVRDFESYFKALGRSGKFENKYYTKIEIPKYKTVYKYRPPHAYMKFHR
jgi:hypothetical protein